ncbi:hypothetical protein CFAM422_005709 [Trichoderma lentiforme]|uniref:Uncharacterized protein n=1 Tax=Trichoderma lentiforme TaxID=1567552 RepID=A0A9P4XGW5_9HYPO|nr:hypothetical protein CFAM422_005709 [Trichoderma lentiforme]
MGELRALKREISADGGSAAAVVILSRGMSAIERLKVWRELRTRLSPLSRGYVPIVSELCLPRTGSYVGWLLRAKPLSNLFCSPAIGPGLSGVLAH